VLSSATRQQCANRGASSVATTEGRRMERAGRRLIERPGGESQPQILDVHPGILETAAKGQANAPTQQQSQPSLQCDVGHRDHGIDVRACAAQTADVIIESVVQHTLIEVRIVSDTQHPPRAPIAIDIRTETLLGLPQLASRLPAARSGRPVHTSTLTRWILNGVRLSDGTCVRLEAIRIGCRWVSSLEAVSRFIGAQTPVLCGSCEGARAEYGAARRSDQ
jgi:hypothetical protein